MRSMGSIVAALSSYLGHRVRRWRRCGSRAGKARTKYEAFHREAERIISDARGWRSCMLAHHRATEEDLRRRARCDCAAHVVRQERKPDLVRSCQSVSELGRVWAVWVHVPFIQPNPSRGTILKSMP